MAHNFRKTFHIVNKEALHWFPGHMGKGLKMMQQKLKSVDCIIEVHDARIPFSGRNCEFKHTISGVKPHLLVLNKKDLAEPKLFKDVAEKIRNDEGIDRVLFTNCKDQNCGGIRKIMPVARDLIVGSNRFNRSDEKDFCVMIIGVPNVGKSSILNVMRNRHLHKKKASPVGAIAGITRSVLTKIKISEDPLVFMVDTPGILTPQVGDTETGMKLALCGCLPDHLVGEDLIADYLLYWLNKNEKFQYVDLVGLSKPTDEIAEVLLAGAKKMNKTQKVKHYDGSIVVRPDLITVAKHIINSFRNGYFGKINLDGHRTS